jgi:triosephosphate isomerase
MRKPVIAGNWKMFKIRDEALQFIYAVNNLVPSVDKVESVICAQATVLRCLVKRQGENLRIGAQNMHYEENGAFTGEIAPEMISSLGVEYVIIGHSERRAMFNETDESVNKKLHASFKHNLKPILCVGEHLAERENGQTEALLREQLTKDFEGLTADVAEKVIIAYEPIWAIGTGKTATKEVANETCGFIRAEIGRLYDAKTADAIRILYGGSVKLSNIDELIAQEHIDGALIGGASLKAEDFVTFTKAALKKYQY